MKKNLFFFITVLFFFLIITLSCSNSNNTGGNYGGDGGDESDDVGYDEWDLPSVTDTITSPVGPVGNSDVGYEIVVRSFLDTNGDGIGDIRGIINKLDYLKNDLGVTLLYISPLCKSPSLHGYDCTDYYSINDSFGSMADFEDLVSEAHNKGIKIVMDLVINHTSNLHPWFVSSALKDKTYNDWYIWRNGTRTGMLNEGWLSFGVAGGWSAHKNRPGEVYYCLFNDWMPDLNYFNYNVKMELCKIFRFWLLKGADGFRLDAVANLYETGPDSGQMNVSNTYYILRKFMKLIKAYNKDAFVIGEVWYDLPVFETYYDNGQGVDLVFDFTFSKVNYNAKNPTIFNAVINNNRSLIYNYLTRSQYVPRSFLAPFNINHDMARYETDFSKRKELMTILLTMPGVPFIFYGEEIGMNNGPGDQWTKQNTPMQWDNSEKGGFTTGNPYTNLGDNNNPYNVEYQKGDSNSLLNTIKKLIQLRKMFSALASNTTEIIRNNNSNIVSYLRGNGVIVVINLADSSNSVILNFSGTSITTSNSVSNLMDGSPMSNITTSNYNNYTLSLSAQEIMLLNF